LAAISFGCHLAWRPARLAVRRGLLAFCWRTLDAASTPH
jgi:hypothetical protein